MPRRRDFLGPPTGQALGVWRSGVPFVTLVIATRVRIRLRDAIEEIRACSGVPVVPARERAPPAAHPERPPLGLRSFVGSSRVRASSPRRDSHGHRRSRRSLPCDFLARSHQRSCRYAFGGEIFGQRERGLGLLFAVPSRTARNLGRETRTLNWHFLGSRDMFCPEVHSPQIRPSPASPPPAGGRPLPRRPPDGSPRGGCRPSTGSRGSGSRYTESSRSNSSAEPGSTPLETMRSDDSKPFRRAVVPSLIGSRASRDWGRDCRAASFSVME